MKLSEKYEKMTALSVTWHLLWDRYFGHQIQARLCDGGYLDDDFIFRIKREAILELRRLESNSVQHVHLQLIH